MIASYLRKQMMQMMDAMQDIDPLKAANYMTMIKVRSTLIDKGLAVDLAELVASSMQISVTHNFVEDEELYNYVVNTYCTVLLRMVEQIRKDFQNPSRAIEGMVKGMSLTYED